jgi:hypothetical protein
VWLVRSSKPNRIITPITVQQILDDEHAQRM